VRRLVGIALLALALAVLLALGPGAAGGPTADDYRVRAIFDFARAVPGEDVKIAGAKAGRIESMDVTPEKKAALVLSFDRPGFTPFHADARCSLRPQSLIGETFVDCQPGSSRTPPLRRLPDGRPGAGQYLLPLERTSSPIDIDLVADTMRLPFRQRLAIIVNEFGTALAGRGRALNEAIHRANPALRDSDRVLGTLARQNHTLARLAGDSDAVIAPLAARRRSVSHFVESADATARATAERRAALSASIKRLPRLLRELRPALRDLGAVSEQSAPVLSELHAAAPGVNRLITQLAPFSRAAVPAFRTLGHAADVGRPALRASRPLVSDLHRFAGYARPLSATLDALARSLDETGAVERAMDFIFFQATAINGFDAISHYLRAGLLVNLCSSYAVEPQAGCNSNFTTTRSMRAEAAPADRRLSHTRAALRAALRGDRPAAPPPERSRGSAAAPRGELGRASPSVASQRRAGIERVRRNSRRPSPALDIGDPAQPALDYLLGNDG
jgi:phospholipid/cholesterol/gamma-HCH transport system substrate-binding protein